MQNRSKDEFQGFQWFPIQISLTFQKQSIAMKYFVNRNGVKQRSSYLRTHFSANRGTKYIKIKNIMFTDTLQSYGSLMLKCWV